MKLRSEALVEASARVATIAVDADLHDDPEWHFESLLRGLEKFEELNPSNRRLIDGARQAITRAIEDLAEHKEAKNKPDRAAEWLLHVSNRS
jgi:hypothetical protein